MMPGKWLDQDMKLAPAFLLVCACLLVAGAPGRADDSGNAGNLVTSPGFFSYQPPDGWFVRESPTEKFKVSYEKLRTAFSPCITVAEDTFRVRWRLSWPGPRTLS